MRYLSQPRLCPKKGRLIQILFILGLILDCLTANPSKAEAPVFFVDSPREKKLLIVEGNTLSPSSQSQPFLRAKKEEKIKETVPVLLTAYSSTFWETDENPYLTAAGTIVRNGVVACNFLPLGTKIKIPEIFGERIFVVEDRMHPKVEGYRVDVWFENYWQALNFGVKKTYIEVLEE